MTQDLDADGWTSALWTGVTTLELAKLIESLVSETLQEIGMWHCVPLNQIITFELLIIMNTTCRESRIRVNGILGILHDRSLINDRLMTWPVPGCPEMMKDLQDWVQGYQGLYQGTVFESPSELDDSETP